MSILGLLQVAFIILKVLGLISWSWFHVFIPLYIYIGCLILYIFTVSLRR